MGFEGQLWRHGVRRNDMLLEVNDRMGEAKLIVTATDSYGASAQNVLYLRVDQVNGLPELAGHWMLYPVPTSEVLNLQLSLDQTSNVALHITDATGRTRVQQPLDTGTNFSHTLHVADWPAGVWFVTLVVDGVPHTRTVVKN